MKNHTISFISNYTYLYIIIYYIMNILVLKIFISLMNITGNTMKSYRDTYVLPVLYDYYIM